MYTHFVHEDLDGTAIIRLRDSELLDRERFLCLAEELFDFVRVEKPQCLVITFEYVRRFSSETVNVLLRIRDTLADHGGRLILCDMRDEIRDVFSILKLGIPIFENLTQALDLVDRSALPLRHSSN